MSFSINKDYDEFQPLTPGRYCVQLTRGELATSKSGKPCVRLRWHVVLGTEAGTFYLETLSLTPTKFGYGRLQELCKAVGVTGSGDDPDGFDPHRQADWFRHLVGKCVMVKTENEAFEDKVFTRSAAFAACGPKAKAALEACDLSLPHDAYTDKEGMPLEGAPYMDKGGGGFESDDNFGDGFDENDIPF